MTLKRFLIQTAVAVFCMAILIGLGIWQLQRKSWKDRLLTQIHEQTGRVPAVYTYWLDRKSLSAGNSGEDPIATGLFAPVVVRGRFRQAEEFYVFTTRRSRPGFLVFTPFDTESGRTIFVNRGFVPEHFRTPAKRSRGMTESEVEVRGLIRAAKRPGWFTPKPDTQNRIWYVEDLNAFARHTTAGLETAHYVEADSTPNPGGWPKGRDVEEIISEIPNKHLGYAMTWFGLAVVLCAVFLAFMRTQLRKSAAGQ